MLQRWCREENGSELQMCCRDQLCNQTLTGSAGGQAKAGEMPLTSQSHIFGLDSPCVFNSQTQKRCTEPRWQTSSVNLGISMLSLLRSAILCVGSGQFTQRWRMIKVLNGLCVSINVLQFVQKPAACWGRRRRLRLSHWNSSHTSLKLLSSSFEQGLDTRFCVADTEGTFEPHDTGSNSLLVVLTVASSLISLCPSFPFVNGVKISPCRQLE